MSWQSVKLKEVADIERDGITSEAIQTGTSYLGLEHIEAGGRILGAATVTAGDLASTKFRFSRNHVLYGKLRPYLAKIAMPDFDGICSTDIVPIMPGPELDRSFLAHYLRQPSMVEFASSRTTGANLPRLSPKSLAEFEIPLPPKNEQKRIAEILDQADELHRKRQRAIDRLNQLGQSIFHEMFGDPFAEASSGTKVALQEVCLVNPKRSMTFSDRDQVSFLPMAAVSELGGINYQEQREFQEVKKGFTYFERSDVLIAKITPCFENGKASKTDSLSHQHGFGSTEFHVIRPNENATASFIFHLFWNQKFRKLAEGQMTGSAGQKRVPASVFKNFQICLPSKDDLARFEARIETIEALQISTNRALKEHNALFSALQHRAFQGRL